MSITAEHLRLFLDDEWNSSNATKPTFSTSTGELNNDSACIVQRIDPVRQYVSAQIERVTELYVLDLFSLQKDESIDELSRILNLYPGTVEVDAGTTGFEGCTDGLAPVHWTCGSGAAHPIVSTTRAHAGSKSLVCTGTGAAQSYAYRDFGVNINHVKFWAWSPGANYPSVIPTFWIFILSNAGGTEHASHGIQNTFKYAPYNKIMCWDNYDPTPYTELITIPAATWFKVEIIVNDDANKTAEYYIDDVLKGHEIKPNTGYRDNPTDVYKYLCFENSGGIQPAYFDELEINGVAVADYVNLNRLAERPVIKASYRGHDPVTQQHCWQVRLAMVQYA